MKRTLEIRLGEEMKKIFRGQRRDGSPMPFEPWPAAAVTHCPDLNAIYGADVYTRGALEGQAATIAALKESLAGAHRSTARYMALAFLGWVAVVIMGVAL